MISKELVDGYWRFRKGGHAADKERYEQLVSEGQSPGALVVSCCDSRVDVSAIFGGGPGDLFVVRNVANLVPPFDPEGKFQSTSAAVEYAVAVLKVPSIIVMGHSQCGGIAAYRGKLKGDPDNTDFVGLWLSQLEGLELNEGDVSAFGEERAFELAGVRRSLSNLRRYSLVRDNEAKSSLTLHGLHFDIASGLVLALDEETDAFLPLPEAVEA
ncbi:MAG: carbonic anhydrase [Alphaproteobacteria bacterium]